MYSKWHCFGKRACSFTRSRITHVFIGRKIKNLHFPSATDPPEMPRLKISFCSYDTSNNSFRFKAFYHAGLAWFNIYFYEDSLKIAAYYISLWYAFYLKLDDKNGKVCFNINKSFSRLHFSFIKTLVYVTSFALARSVRYINGILLQLLPDKYDNIHIFKRLYCLNAFVWMRLCVFHIVNRTTSNVFVSDIA